MRYSSGQVGHGVELARVSGGLGMISSWVIERAPWRIAVPRQSAPVSPPPMMTTSLPSAVIGGACSVALLHPVGRDEVLHRQVDAREVAAGRRQVAAEGRAAGEHDGVVLRPQLLDGDVDADVDAGAEDRALGAHLLQPAVQDRLLHLELGDAVAQQPADAVGPLEHDDLVAGPGQLLGGGEPGRARSRRRRPCVPVRSWRGAA